MRQCPAPEAIHIPALREKYREERDKRNIREATNQKHEEAGWVRWQARS